MWPSVRCSVPHSASRAWGADLDVLGRRASTQIMITQTPGHKLGTVVPGSWLAFAIHFG